VIIISAVLSVLNSIWPYALAVILFISLIAIHEFGHFIAAKLLGVRVNEFAIGFGPKLFSKKIGETEYSVKLVPFGGYCAMEGEDEESGDSRAFCNKKAWRRFIIVAMGAIFNLIFGLILVAIILTTSDHLLTTRIAEFNEGAVSCDSGLMVDDKIVEVNGRKIYTTYDLSYAFTNVKDGKLDVVVEREGKDVAINDVEFKTEKFDNISYVSVDFKVYGLQKTIGNVISETLLNKDRYTPIDEVIKVGTKVNTPPPVVVEPDVPVTPVQPEEPEEPDRDLPPGWDSPESPYA
jgi:regulator of sigma E protease